MNDLTDHNNSVLKSLKRTQKYTNYKTRDTISNTIK